MFGPGGKTGLGAFGQSGSGGHHIINEQHVFALQCRAIFRVWRDCAKDALKAGIAVFTVHAFGDPAAAQGIGLERQAEMLGGKLCDKAGLIVATPDQAKPVQRDRDDEGAGCDVGPERSEPETCGFGVFRAITMFESKDDFAGVGFVMQRGAARGPRAGDGKAVIALFVSALIFAGQLRATSVTGEPGNEGRFAPTGSAKGHILFDLGIAGQALRRVENAKGALQFHRGPLSSGASVNSGASLMSTPPALCDRTQLVRQRSRARGMGSDLFLHKEAAVEVKERLIDVNRTFTDVAIVTGHPEFWGETFPDAKIIADSDVLALEAGAHDLVIHAMCLHWANDPVGQLVQARRALRADGFLLAGFFGGQTLSELRAALGQTEVALSGGLSPRVAPMGEIRDVGGLLQRAGLALPVADCVKTSTSYKSALHLMRDLRAMGEGNALAMRSKRSISREMLEMLEETYKSAFQDENGRLRATYELIFLSGWAPDASQQKPLRPGSAKTRLAEFLNTPELGPDAKPVRGTKP